MRMSIPFFVYYVYVSTIRTEPGNASRRIAELVLLAGNVPALVFP